MGYLVEVTYPRDPDDRRRETFDCLTAADAALRFDSEASPQNYPTEAIEADLLEQGQLEHVDDETERTVTVQREDPTP